MSFKLLITIILVSLLLSAGLLGYRLAYQSPSLTEAPSSGVTSGGLLDTDQTGRTDTSDAEYTRLLKVISAIPSIDDSIFASPAFDTLFDFSPNIPPQAPGRSNPFLPTTVR